MLIGKQEKYIERFGEPTVEADALPGLIMETSDMRYKFNIGMNEDTIRQSIESNQLVHHPMWIIQNTVIVARGPFKPRHISNMIFVDAVSGYRGLLSPVPVISEVAVDKNSIVPPIIEKVDVVRYVKDVQTRQIDRSYLLGKPQHESTVPRLVHLPLWKIVIAGEEDSEIHYINANTGESEDIMSRRWSTGEDLIN